VEGGPIGRGAATVLHWIVEDPWPLIIACGLVAVAALVALKITQRGAFLVVTLSAVGLAALLWLLDTLVVTDVERVEDTVHALARAVGRSDADAVVALLTPDVVIAQETGGRDGEIVSGPLAHAAIRAALPSIKFDTAIISNMQTTAGALSRQGKADFRFDTSGMAELPTGHRTFTTVPNGTDWSLGFRETAPGVWKVTRITAVRLPSNASLASVLGGQGP
jgi:ketosteroid isomerase-like protein